METGLRRRFAPPQDAARGMMPELARVIAVDNAQRRVDVAVEGSGVLRDVPVLCDMAGTHFGSPFIGTVDNPPNADRSGSGPYADMVPSGTNDTWAILIYVRGNIHRPYVVGFLFGEQFEGSFANVEVEKHMNGVYLAYTSDGFELSHPSGFFIKVGSGTAKTNLVATNYDSQSVPFSDTNGTASATPDVVISHPTGFSLRITPAGDCIITKVGGVSFNLGTHQHSGVTVGAGVSGGPQ